MSHHNVAIIRADPLPFHLAAILLRLQDEEAPPGSGPQSPILMGRSQERDKALPVCRVGGHASGSTSKDHVTPITSQGTNGEVPVLTR
eukprot:6883603-Heterocapsa_arctica.AAC.1